MIAWSTIHGSTVLILQEAPEPVKIVNVNNEDDSLEPTRSGCLVLSGLGHTNWG